MGRRWRNERAKCNLRDRESCVSGMVIQPIRRASHLSPVLYRLIERKPTSCLHTAAKRPVSPRLESTLLAPSSAAFQVSVHESLDGQRMSGCTRSFFDQFRVLLATHLLPRRLGQSHSEVKRLIMACDPSLDQSKCSRYPKRLHRTQQYSP